MIHHPENGKAKDEILHELSKTFPEPPRPA